jgi:hypothetical protein
MPLTRHFYELDEVVAALQLCILRNWGRGIFWLWELVVSKEEARANEILVDLWIRSGGGLDPFLFEEPLIHARAVRVMAAIRRGNARNATNLLTKAAAQPQRQTMTPLPASPQSAHPRLTRTSAYTTSLTKHETMDHKDAATWWISLDAACRQYATLEALWLLQAVQPLLSSDAIWSALQIACRGSPQTKKAIATLQMQNPDILNQANAILLLSMPTKERETIALVKPEELPSYKHEWATWSAQEGRRSARIHTIPAEALHEGTSRGATPSRYTNIGDVRDPVALLAEGCKFWTDALTATGVTVDKETGATIFPDDDVLEAFYERYFLPSLYRYG